MRRLPALRRSLPGQFAERIYGYEVTVEQALKARVEEDEAFYSRSGGGLTLSGGEPLFQSEFTLALLREAKKRRIDTCIETCGNVPWPVSERGRRQFEQRLFTTSKSMDDKKHREVTGVSNKLILSNLKNSEADLPGSGSHGAHSGHHGHQRHRSRYRRHRGIHKGHALRTGYELLAYHRMGTPKYGYLGKEYALEEVPNLPENRIEELYEVARGILGRPSGCERQRRRAKVNQDSIPDGRHMAAPVQVSRTKKRGFSHEGDRFPVQAQHSRDCYRASPTARCSRNFAST